MLVNLKLKNRMLLGYIIPLVVYVGVGGLVYSTATKVLDTFKDVERVQKVVIEANNMALATQGMVRNSGGYLIDKNEQFAQEYQTEVSLAKEAANSANELIKKPDQKERLTQMLTRINDYDRFSSSLISMAAQGKQAEAIALFKTGEGTKYVNEFNELNKNFNKTEQDLLTEETNQSKQQVEFLILALIIGSLVLTLLDVITALLISAGVSSTINQAVDAIASSSTEIAATVEQQERTAAQQAVAVSETSTTMDELGASSQQSAEQAEAAAASTRQALALVASNKEQFSSDTLEQSSLREKVAQISDQIFHLSEQTHQIGSISTLVSDLANQTNMLALNAAVEAVRAGEHGKGFAVVANEIRKLADQSKKSADRINNLVNDIQNATNTTVTVTNEGRKTVDDIVAAINNIAVNSQQISLTAKQQAIAIQQVVESMNNLTFGASQTAQGLNQTKIGTQKLNETAHTLKAMV